MRNGILQAVENYLKENGDTMYTPTKPPKSRGGALKRILKPKKKKLPSLASLKRKADAAFSKYIRTLDIDRDGETACVTCGARMPWQRIQCGHFVSRVHLATRFLELNAVPQCMACNVWRRGNPIEFCAYLQRTHGHGVIETLLAEKRKTVKFTRADYMEMIERFSSTAGRIKTKVILGENKRFHREYWV